MLPNVRPLISGAPIIPVPTLGDPFRPITMGTCTAGGDHNWGQWSGKTRCTKCGQTQG